MATALSVSSASKLRPLHMPAVVREVSSRGMPVWVAQKGPLPLVALRLIIHAGSSDETPGQEGLAEFTTQLLRRGTKRMTADQLNEAVEFVGGSLGMAAAEDYLAIGMTVPAEHVDAMLDILGQLVSEPSFPKNEVEMARRRVLAEMANDLDDPGYLAERALLRAFWGKHPYGHDVRGRRLSVEGFTRDDIVGFHRRFFTPKNAALVVVGDVDPRGFLKKVESAFVKFKGEAVGKESPPVWKAPAMAGGILVVDKPEMTQTQIRIAGPGVAKGHPDYFDYSVMNTVLGGGFTSRLVGEIRVKRGLSYGAASYFHSLKHSGTFGFSSFTKTETTRELIDVALSAIESMKAKGPKATEIASSIQYINGNYPARVETNEAVSGVLADQLVFGTSPDWVDLFRERMAAVTKQSAWRAAKNHLPGDNRVMVLVGNAEKIVPQLKGLGKVTVIRAAELE